MARHYLRAAGPKPRAEIRAAPSFYERTHPVGSAERFLDQAAREALAAAAAGGVITPKRAAFNAVKAVAKEVGKYPDSVLAEAARLPKDELLRRAARAEALQKAREVQNKVVTTVAAVNSPVGKMATTLAAADAAAALGTQQASKGGDAGSGTAVSETPVSEAPQNPGGPRIVINPTTFTNKKDALCVAFNEGFRLWMEATGFEPQSEPTDKQRKFFADTAYGDDELQLRRTILARIATFDTSVKDPTDDQLAETASFLNAVLESDWCKNEWERSSVEKLARAVEAAVGAEPVEPRAEPVEPRTEAPLEARAALGGGEVDEEHPLDPKPVEATSGASTGEAIGAEGVAVDARRSPASGIEEPIQVNPDGTLAENPAGGGAVNPQNPAGNPVGVGNPQNPQNPQNPAGNVAVQPAANGQEPGQAPAKPNGLYSGVWTGGEEGKGRQLTESEAEFMRRRIDSGASVSGSQLAMFGLSRNEEGRLVDANGELHKGFDAAAAVRANNPGARLDARNRRRRLR